jgi:PAS domain-containing protein
MTTSHPSKTLVQSDEPVKGEVKYRALFELCPVAIFLLDDDGNFLATNSPLCRLSRGTAATGSSEISCEEMEAVSP